VHNRFRGGWSAEYIERHFRTTVARRGAENLILQSYVLGVISELADFNVRQAEWPCQASPDVLVAHRKCVIREELDACRAVLDAVPQRRRVPSGCFHLNTRTDRAFRVYGDSRAWPPLFVPRAKRGIEARWSSRLTRRSP